MFLSTIKKRKNNLFVSLINICLTSVTRVKCGIRATLCWKIANISGSTELSLIVILDSGFKLPKLSIHTLVMLEKGLEIHEIII